MAIRVRYEPAAAGLAHAADISGRGQLAKEQQRFAEQQRQFEEQLAARQREFDISQALAQEKFEEGIRQHDIGHEFREKGFGENVRQFDVRQDFHDRGLDEGTRRFNLGYGLDRSRFAEAQQQFDINDWFRRRQAVEGQRRFNLGLQADYARMAQQNAQFGASLGQRQAESDALNRYRGASLWQAAHQAELGRQHDFELGLQQHDLASQRIGQQHSNLQELQDQQRIHREAKSQWDAIVADQRRGVLDSAQYDEAIAKWHEQWGPQGVTSPYEPPDTRTPGQVWWDDIVPDSPDVAPEGYTGPTKQDGYFNFETGVAEFPGWVTRQQKESHDSALESQEVIRRAKEQELRLLEEQASETRRVNRDNEIQTKREQRQKEYQAGIEGAEAKYDQEIKEYNEDVESDLSSDWGLTFTTPEVTEENMEFWARTGQRVEFNKDGTVKDYGDIPRDVRDATWSGSVPGLGWGRQSDAEKARWARLWKAYDEREAARGKARTDAETGFSNDLAAVPMDNKFNTGTPEETSAAFTAKLMDPKDGIGIGEMVQIAGHTVRVTPNLHAAAMEYQRAPDGSPEQSALLTVLVQEIRAARETL